MQILLEPAPPHGQTVALPAMAAADGVLGEDFQLSLYVLYELHYRGFRGVDEGWEWQPSVLGLRSALEADFEATLRELLMAPAPPPAERVGAEIIRLVEADDALSLSAYMERSASLEQFRELLIHRSAYQLKEADPHSWAIPRLQGPAKAALVEVQADEQQAYEAVLAAVDALPDAALFTPHRFAWVDEDHLWESIPGNVHEHYEEHIPPLQAWLAATSA
jgi:hypothetical protein